MKIGIYSPYLDSMSGGEKYMLKAAICLADKHDVSVFWDPNQEQIIKSEAKRKFKYDLSKVKFADNIFSPSISFFSRYKFTKSYDRIFYLSDGSIPVVNSNLYVHFQFPVEWVKNSFKTKLKMNRVKRVICNSFFTKSFIDRKFSIESSVLYPPVDTKPGELMEKKNLILHVGRYDVDSKGINFKKQDVMIEAFKKMVDSGLRLWRFVVVVGAKKEDEDKLNILKNMIQNYPIDIVENPSNDEIRKLYSQAKIYWHATGFGEDLEKYPEKAEHFGMSTADAMVYKAVPVVINQGGQKEIVEEGKTGFLWDSIEQLIGKTNEIIASPNHLKEIGDAASLSSNRFSEDRFCEELTKYLDL